MSMLMTGFAMVQGKISGNLMSLGAIDFGIIIDGAVIIVENCHRTLPNDSMNLNAGYRFAERLDAVADATRQSVFSSHPCLDRRSSLRFILPILFLTGTEGKMFQPMAITVIIALAAPRLCCH